MSGRIFVCTTCNRYSPPPPGEPTPGSRLAEAMIEIEGGRKGSVAIRTVVCLNNCPKPCAGALREPGKYIIRFSGLTANDAPTLLEVAERYGASADGDVPLETFPADLRSKVAGRIPPPVRGALPPVPEHGPVHDPVPALPGFGP
jgi:predicted metal-binding protein